MCPQLFQTYLYKDGYTVNCLEILEYKKQANGMSRVMWNVRLKKKFLSVGFDTSIKKALYKDKL